MVRRSRVWFVASGAVLIVAPLLFVPGSLLTSDAIGNVWNEAERITGLLRETMLLALLTCLFAVPLGSILALILTRFPVPRRSLLRFLLLIGVLLPLPVHAVAWQIILGSWLPPLSLNPGEVAWRPWNQGLLPAAWVHAVAGLPWVVWIVSIGIQRTDVGLEEDALMQGGPAMVLRRVLLPRVVLGALCAAAWLTVLVSTEIAITDAMMVRTYAEEVYTRFVSGGDGLAEALACTVPIWFIAIVGVLLLARPIVRRFEESPSESISPRLLKCGSRLTVGLYLGAWLVTAVVIILPLLALLWKASGGGTREGIGFERFAVQMGKVIHADGFVLLNSLPAALVTGAFTSMTAWVLLWAAGGSRIGNAVLLVLCVVLWLTPGPVVGLALLDAIHALLDVEDLILAHFHLQPEFPPLRSLLYDQPSPVPAAWAAMLRFLPIAVVFLRSAMRGIPKDLLEAAQLDGFGRIGEWRLVLIPFCGAAYFRSTIAVAALALGEVSAAKIVNPPSRSVFILRLFDQMHYGAEATVAALCLLQIGVVTVAAWAILKHSEPRL